jgi:hypothetical protein
MAQSSVAGLFWNRQNAGETPAVPAGSMNAVQRSNDPTTIKKL